MRSDSVNKKKKPLCVYAMKRNGKPYRWMVRTVVKGEPVYLGCYESMEKAVEAWNRYAVKNGKQVTSIEALTE